MLSEKQKLDTLMVLGIELNRILDLDILLERVLTRARQFVNADAGSIYTREGNRLNVDHSQNDTLRKRLKDEEKLIFSTFSIPIDEMSIAGYAAATAKMLNIPDVYKLPPTKSYHFNKKFDELSGYVTRSMLTIPLIGFEDTLVGVLQILNKNNGVFDDQDEWDQDAIISDLIRRSNPKWRAKEWGALSPEGEQIIADNLGAKVAEADGEVVSSSADSAAISSSWVTMITASPSRATRLRRRSRSRA